MSGSRVVARAESGSAGWREAARLQLRASARHEDFYGLAGELVTTLHALDDLVGVLARQVACYGSTARGVVYDDSRHERRPVDPTMRLRQAAGHLDHARAVLVDAAGAVTAAWSAIGHIGVDLDPEPGGRVVGVVVGGECGCDPGDRHRAGVRSGGRRAGGGV